MLAKEGDNGGFLRRKRPQEWDLVVTGSISKGVLLTEGAISIGWLSEEIWQPIDDFCGSRFVVDCRVKAK